MTETTWPYSSLRVLGFQESDCSLPSPSILPAVAFKQTELKVIAHQIQQNNEGGELLMDYLFYNQ